MSETPEIEVRLLKLIHVIRNKISVSPEYNKKLKREVLARLDQSLFVWDSDVKGFLVKYHNLKLEKKLIELVDVQDYITIPIIYEAIYFIPKPMDFTCKISNLFFRCRSFEYK